MILVFMKNFAARLSYEYSIFAREYNISGNSGFYDRQGHFETHEFSLGFLYYFA